jgi:AcrR family transcriptional regulator
MALVLAGQEMDVTRTIAATTPTEQRALDCLKALALEKGLGAVSMRDVARRLGLSLAALQYHYPNKAALLEAFVRQTVGAYRERIEAVLAASANGERFVNLVRFAATETLQWDRHSVLAMIEGRASQDDAAKSAVLLFFRSYLEIMRAAVIADAPDVAPAKALLTVTLAVSMLEGLPSLIEPACNLGADRNALVEMAVRVATALPGDIVPRNFS